MTIIRGVTISEAPCCGRHYASPRYLSIHIGLSNQWSDGWHEDGHIWGNVEGLCECSCGHYLVRQRDLVHIGKAENTDLPYLEPIEAHRLPKCIEASQGTELERTARLVHWRFLNQHYRDTYNEQRILHEARVRFEWEQANPDRRNWWQRLRGHPAPVYRPARDDIFPPLPFKPAALQIDNMQRLCELLVLADCNDDELLTLAELQRELGRFDESLATLRRVGEKQQNELYALIQSQATEENPAPMWVPGYLANCLNQAKTVT